MNQKKNVLILILGIILMLMTPLASAQTGSLKVWENIADGTLTSDWFEAQSDAYWKGQDESGIWSYNYTDELMGWATNYTYNASRWFQTLEVYDTSDAEAGVGVTNVIDDTRFYAVIYYLDFNGTGPECYLLYYNTSDVFYWDDGVGWDSNVSNATDYSGDCEVDYLTGGQARIKALWNWDIDDGTSNCSVRFKIWDPSGDEPQYWMLDDNFTYHPLDVFAEIHGYYPGIVADHSWEDGGDTTTLFRRIFFWELSYDLYAPILPLVNNEIACPTMTADEFYTTWDEYMDTEDIWNETQLFKDYINLYDLQAIYTDDLWGDAANQNDTTYVFTLMMTDTREFFEEFFGPEIPDEFPDNTLGMFVYNTPDGSQNESDYMLLRIDTDNNDVYDSYDYAIWSNDTNITLYQGWTEFESWFVSMFAGAVMSDEFGEVFRDDSYYLWKVFIDWDMIYNGSSSERVGSDLCRMSIGWYDNDTDVMLLLQDFDPEDDEDPNPETDGRNATRDPVWEQYNDSSNWIYFYVDESISGVPLADPVDPAAPTTAIENIMDAIWMIIYTIFVLALIGFVMGVLSKIMRK